MLDPQAVLLSILASMTTSLGAALVFLVKGTSHRTRDALVLFLADTYLPHIHGVLIPDKPLPKGMKTALMLVAALVIHNFPEGFATRTAYAGGVPVRSEEHTSELQSRLHLA